MNLSVVDSGGKKTTPLEASGEVFDVAYNEPLVHQIVVAYGAGMRSGTSAQKNRSAVAGGGAKPFRQKGTGRARAGTRRSPIWRGGGRAFAASTRDYSQKVNRKMYRAGIRSIVSELVRQDRLVVCDEVMVTQVKTKSLASLLSTIACENALILVHEPNEHLFLSARNLHSVTVCEVRHIDPLLLVGHERVVATTKSIQLIEQWLQ